MVIMKGSNNQFNIVDKDSIYHHMTQTMKFSLLFHTFGKVEKIYLQSVACDCLKRYVITGRSQRETTLALCRHVGGLSPL